MELLNKALLTSATGSALIPYDLNPAILEYLGKINPLWAAIPKKQADSKTHEYTVRTAVPSARFEGELTDPSAVSSTYARSSVQLKIMRIAGGVSGYQQAVTERFVDALQTEVSGAVEGFGELVEWATLYGNKNDAYQFDGLEALMLADSAAKKSISAGGNILDVDGVISLSHLDAMIDAVNSYRGGQRDRRVFVASNSMISKISGLQTKISRNVQSVEFEGGFRMLTYRDLPLVPSSYVSPAATTTSPAVSAAAAAGGSLPDLARYYAIASVTPAGEQLMGSIATATTATTNNSVALTWTADANALLYKVYRGDATGADNMGLLATIAAKTYDGTGAVSGTVAAYTDDGSATVNTAVRPLATGEENIFLVDLDPTRGIQFVGKMSPLGEAVDSFVSFVPLATRKSAYEFLIESFMAMIAPYPALHAIARRAKTA